MLVHIIFNVHHNKKKYMNKRVVVVAAVDIAVRLFELFLGSFVCEPVCGDGGGGGGYMYTQTMAKNYL